MPAQDAYTTLKLIAQGQSFDTTQAIRQIAILLVRVLPALAAEELQPEPNEPALPPHIREKGTKK